MVGCVWSIKLVELVYCLLAMGFDFIYLTCDMFYDVNLNLQCICRSRKKCRDLGRLNVSHCCRNIMKHVTLTMMGIPNVKLRTATTQPESVSVRLNLLKII